MATKKADSDSSCARFQEEDLDSFRRVERFLKNAYPQTGRLEGVMEQLSTNGSSCYTAICDPSATPEPTASLVVGDAQRTTTQKEIRDVSCGVESRRSWMEMCIR